MTQIIHTKHDCISNNCHGECHSPLELYKVYRKETDSYRAITNFESWLGQIGVKQSYIDECKRTLDRDEVNEIVIGKDNVNHPPHYQSEIIRCEVCQSKIECIEVTRHMNFNLGNAIKYIWRCESKGKQVEDLKKAVWYLNDEIRKLEK